MVDHVAHGYLDKLVCPVWTEDTAGKTVTHVPFASIQGVGRGKAPDARHTSLGPPFYPGTPLLS